jgi:protein phosphatase
MQLEVAGFSHVGMKRGHNEDNFLLLREEGLFCVADGMGGHAKGEVASQMAIDEVADFFRSTSKDRERTWPFKMDQKRNYSENRLAIGIQLANRRIWEINHTEEDRKKDMGTTIVSVFFEQGEAYVGHVGDSRVYRYRRREGKLIQLTEDHSLLNDYIKSGKVKPEDAVRFPFKNVIMRALGINDRVVVDVTRMVPEPGDTFLLCSDGLTGMVPDPEMLAILEMTDDLDKASHQLVDKANANGGTDNITCVLVRVTDAKELTGV